MRNFFLLLIFCSHLSLLFGQTTKEVSYFNSLDLKKQIEYITDKLTKDTLKFSPKDLYHTRLGTFNTNPYSPLFVINGQQYFKFDIVEKECVEEFIDAYLHKAKVKSVHMLNHTGIALYGTLGKNGVIVVWIKKLKKANTKSCGFQSKGRRAGSNLDQKKKGDIRIIH